MKPFHAPYLLPSESTYSFDSWQRVVAGDVEPLPDTIAGWAPGTPIRLRRSVSMDLDGLLTTSGLDPSTELWINTSWIGSRSKIREGVGRQPAATGVNVVEVALPAERVGGTVTVQTTVCLATEAEGRAGAASRPGSILARDTLDLVLEGDSSSFPTMVVDFTTTTADTDSSWHLVVGDDLESSFGGNFLLEVNERDQPLVKAIEAEKQTSEQRALVNSMMAGVGETLLEMALHLDTAEPFADREFEDGSVGAVLSGLLRRAGLRTGIPEDAVSRADFRCSLQGAARRLGFGKEL